MNKRSKPFSLQEGKVQASMLLKALHSTDAAQVAKRFQCLPEFANLSTTDILQQDIKRKHALAVIALENGFNSWLDAKIQLNFIVGGYLNPWFAHYDEAKAHLQSSGGFLLPYKKQFFICEANYLSHIGFDPMDSDWALIHNDWAKPADQVAWQRLYKKWIKAKGGRDE
jgi:hypothetical protein